MSGEITLDLLVEQLALERDIQRVTAQQYRQIVRQFSDFLGRPGIPSDLAEHRVNLFTSSLQQRYDPVTVRNKLRALLVVWNYAASLDLVADYSRSRVRRPKVPRKPVEAWTGSQVQQIEAAAAAATGTTRRGCPVKDYLLAYVLVAADTLLRPSDMRRLLWSHVTGQALTITQRKTGRPVCRPLRTVTVEALERLRPYSADRIFWLTKSSQRKHEDRLRRAAGVWHAGRALGRLRHAGATEIARRDGIESASSSLGHAPGSVVAAAHYVACVASGSLPW